MWPWLAPIKLGFNSRNRQPASLLGDRVEEHIKFWLVRVNGFRRAGELEKQVAAGTFNDRAEQAIRWFHGLVRRHRPTHSGIRAGGVDDGYLEAVNRALGDLRGGTTMELILPPFQVSVDAAALTFAEEVDRTLCGIFVARRGWNIVRCSAHWTSAGFCLPTLRFSPFQPGHGFSSEQCSEAKQHFHALIVTVLARISLPKGLLTAFGVPLYLAI